MTATEILTSPDPTCSHASECAMRDLGGQSSMLYGCQECVQYDQLLIVEQDAACRFSTCCNSVVECYDCPDHSRLVDDNELSAAPQPVIDPLRAQAELVRDLRLEGAGIRDEINQARQQWEERSRPLLDAANINGIALREAEDDLRALAIKHFSETGDKKPGPGVSIKMMTRLHYELHVALEWAREHRLFLVEQLDRPAFEKFARANPEQLALYVETSEEPMATIATDLAKVLEG